MATNHGHETSQMYSKISAEPYDWPHNGALDTTKTALLVIDMQRDCTS